MHYRILIAHIKDSLHHYQEVDQILHRTVMLFWRRMIVALNFLERLWKDLKETLAKMNYLKPLLQIQKREKHAWMPFSQKKRKKKMSYELCCQGLGSSIHLYFLRPANEWNLHHHTLDDEITSLNKGRKGKGEKIPVLHFGEWHGYWARRKIKYDFYLLFLSSLRQNEKAELELKIEKENRNALLEKFEDIRFPLEDDSMKQLSIFLNMNQLEYLSYDPTYILLNRVHCRNGLNVCITKWVWNSFRVPGESKIGTDNKSTKKQYHACRNAQALPIACTRAQFSALLKIKVKSRIESITVTHLLLVVLWRIFVVWACNNPEHGVIKTRILLLFLRFLHPLSSTLFHSHKHTIWMMMRR